MVFGKIKKLLKSETEPNEEDKYSMSIIGGNSYANADCIYGIVNITDDIDAAIVELLPQGTINKSFEKKSIILKERTVAVIEISTEVKYDYKETGVFSKWKQSKPRFSKYHYQELKNKANQFRDVSTEVPCQVVVMFPPVGTKIDVENELVYSFLDDKFQNKIVKPNDERNEHWKSQGVQEAHEWSNITLKFSGLELAFRVVYNYPNTATKIDENTHISYVVPEEQPSDYNLKMVNCLPKKFRRRFLENIPLIPAEKLRISEDKGRDAYIEQMKLIQEIRQEFRNNLKRRRRSDDFQEKQ